MYQIIWLWLQEDMNFDMYYGHPTITICTTGISILPQRFGFKFFKGIGYVFQFFKRRRYVFSVLNGVYCFDYSKREYLLKFIGMGYIFEFFSGNGVSFSVFLQKNGVSLSVFLQRNRVQTPKMYLPGPPPPLDYFTLFLMTNVNIGPNDHDTQLTLGNF